jgi:hypothetical protein
VTADRGYRWWLATRWRQWRNPPPPVVRAVVSNLVVAIAGAVLVLAYDLALTRGATLPGGDLRALVVALYVAVVVVAGSALTYLWVELPTGASGERRRSGWAAMLGLFTALPMAYLVLVVAFQIVRPLLG